MEPTNQLLVELREASQRAKEMIASEDFDYSDAQFLVLTLAEKFPALDAALTNGTGALPRDWSRTPHSYPTPGEARQVMCENDKHEYVVDYLPATDNGESTTFKRCTRCGKTQSI